MEILMSISGAFLSLAVDCLTGRGHAAESIRRPTRKGQPDRRESGTSIFSPHIPRADAQASTAHSVWASFPVWVGSCAQTVFTFSCPLFLPHPHGGVFRPKICDSPAMASGTAKSPVLARLQQRAHFS